jgi:2'-5' RNA ligase
MRLFTGISIAPDVVHHLSLLLDHLRPTAHLKWSPVYNLHITTKFIGEWPSEKLEILMSALGQIRTREPIEIAVDGLGWLPNPHRPRILFAAVRAPETLEALAKATEVQLESLGVAAEKRPFSPHITLARIKEPNPLVELKRAIAHLPSVNFGMYTAGKFHLFESLRGPAGTVYTHLADFPLTSETTDR